VSRDSEKQNKTHDSNAGERSKDDLLDDLENIRSLLDKEQLQAASSEDSQATVSPVPLLDDVVGGGLGVDESPLTERTADIENAGGLDDDLFAALLSDAWKSSATEMLKETRADIEANRETWRPEHTDSLNEALRVRIDETLKVWLAELVRSNLSDLRDTLLKAVDDQLKQEIKTFLAAKASPSDTTADDKYGQ
jgi:hypothetical protein